MRDHVYFRDRGWFESDYYYPTRLGPFKKAAGALFDWIAARIFRPRNARPSAGVRLPNEAERPSDYPAPLDRSQDLAARRAGTL